MDGEWTGLDTGTLVFDVVASTLANVDYVFSIEVRNNDRAQDHSEFTVEASLLGDAGTPDLSMQRAVTSDVATEMQTMYVEPTTFVSMTVENDNPLPCSANTLRVHFVTNVPLHEFCHPMITVIPKPYTPKTPRP